MLEHTVAASTGDRTETSGVDTIPSLFWDRVSRGGEKVAFREKRLGIWQETTWSDFGERVRACAYGLMGLGVEPGDRVAILSEDRPDWFVSDLATLSVGAVTVGLYATAGAEPCGYLVGHSESKIWIVEDQEQFDKAIKVRHELPTIEWIVVIDPKGLRHVEDPVILSFEELLDRGRRMEKAEPERLRERMENIQPDDTAILVYTSGTTGRPKGVIHSHRSLIEGVRPILPLMDTGEDDEDIIYLPLCHIMERLTFVAGLIQGGVSNFAERPETLFSDMKEIAPTLLKGVPRTWEKLKAKVEISMEEATWLKRRAYRWSLAVGHRVCRAELREEPVPFRLRALHFLAEKGIMRKLRQRWGLHRVRNGFCGAAPVSPEVLEFFLSIGVPIREGYGQAESGIFIITPKQRIRPGKAGVAVPGVQYRVSDGGEILWRTPGMFQGYLKNQEATEQAFVDGWFHSGDLGSFDDEGYLEIQGRASDSFVTSKGRNVYPQHIENMLKASDYIMDAVVVGESKPHLTALIVLDEETVSHYAQTHSIPFSSFADLSRRPEIVRLIEGEIRKVNERWSDREQILDFRILKWELSHDEEELTPTLKVRRKYLCRRYQDLIEEMYPHGTN